MNTTTRGRYRKPRNHTPLAIAVAAVTTLLVLIGACSADTAAEVEPDPPAVEESEPEAEPVVDETTEPQPEPEPEPTEPTIGAIGDTATITQDWGEGAAEGTVTVSAIEVATLPYDEWGEAPKHGVFVMFTVDVTADGVFEVYEGDFYVRAPDGTRYDVGDGNSFDAADYDDQLGWVDLNAGEKKSGLLVFDVPEAVGELAYAPNYNDGPIVEWAFDEDAS